MKANCERLILFATSIYENIRFGKENATRAEIEEAARQANAHNFIMQLPNKYATVVGERGIQLSGGEKQRVVLARALVKQPALLLLDEATSALDNTNEKIVQEALDQACQGRTTIVIAHRLSAVQNAHRIYVLGNGRVTEQVERSRHLSHNELDDKNKYTAFAVSGSKLTERICIKAFAQYLRQEIAFFDRPENSSGTICIRLSSDALAVQQMVGSHLGIVGESVAIFGIGIVFGFWFSWKLALIVFFAIAALFLLALIQIRREARLNKRCDYVVGLASSSDFQGAIEFKKVKFAYPSRPTSCILDKFQLTIKPCQRVALAGASGCGKSTVVQLLERFYDPVQGEICLDGVDIRQLNIQWLRSSLGLVSQEPILFNLTIAQNIAYGKENTSIEDIIDAATKANIHDFIQQLPQGYETRVGMRGVHLSGGEKQRITIARVLLRRPKILLLDEATSAMDSYNEE
ncbi:unnamed protein product, partial [Rotaria sp. Silwood1]